MTKSKKTVRQIAEEHWNYNKGILLALDKELERHQSFALMKYFYIESFVHGYKHGKEDKEIK